MAHRGRPLRGGCPRSSNDWAVGALNAAILTGLRGLTDEEITGSLVIIEPGPALRRPSDDSPSVPDVPRGEATQPRARPQLREDGRPIRFHGDEHRHLFRPERTIRGRAIRLDLFRRDATPAHDVTRPERSAPTSLPNTGTTRQPMTLALRYFALTFAGVSQSSFWTSRYHARIGSSASRCPPPELPEGPNRSQNIAESIRKHYLHQSYCHCLVSRHRPSVMSSGSGPKGDRCGEENGLSAASRRTGSRIGRARSAKARLAQVTRISARSVFGVRSAASPCHDSPSITSWPVQDPRGLGPLQETAIGGFRRASLVSQIASRTSSGLGRPHPGPFASS